MSDTQQAMNTTTDAVAADATAKVQEIVVVNPSSEEMAALLKDIKVNYDFAVDTQQTQFNFKKSKDKDTGIETIRHPVVLALPYPSVEGIVAILEKGGKGLELLQEAMQDVVNKAARDILYDDTTLTAATFPVDKVSWEFIANLPKAQRKGGGIPKEVWEAFSEDYIAVMPEAAGKTVEQITNMAKILMGKLNAIKTNEPVLQLVVEQLGIYAEATENMEDYADCVAFLLNKAETFLNVSEEELLANL